MTARFKQLNAATETITIYFEEQPFEVAASTSVAAALLSVTTDNFCFSAAQNEPRAPYCMMGVCFECLLTIDEKKHRQACMIQVKDQMRIRKNQ